MKKFGYSSFNGYAGYCNGIQGLYFNWRGLQRLPLSLLFSTSSISSTSKEGNNNPCSSSSFSLVNYLVNSLGFSKHQSLSLCTKFTNLRQLSKWKNAREINLVEKATCVVHFLEQHGFQEPDIRKLIIREPRILVSNVKETLEPKFKLLFDLGLSGSQLILVITRNPFILRYDLGPVIHAFRTVLGSDENVVCALKRSNGTYLSNVGRYLIPNVTLLQSHFEIPSDKILKFILWDAKAIAVSTHVFQDNLLKVEQKLGIPRDSGVFLYGLRFMASFSEKSIEDKFAIFKSFGWKQSDVTALIRRNPMSLTSSEARIREKLDFLMNQLDYKPDFLASQPVLFTCSVKKRLLPRHRVLQVLKEKQVFRMNYSLVSAALMSDPCFFKRFVLPFAEVHQLYAQLTGSTVESLTVGRAED